MADTITVTARKYVRGAAPGETFEATKQDAVELFANGLIDEPKPKPAEKAPAEAPAAPAPGPADDKPSVIVSDKRRRS